ncbi:MAG: cation:proton antiporter [Waddliaceae bacterium]
MYPVESLFILLLGLIAVISILIKSLLTTIKWSPIPFYIIFGLVSRQLIDAFGLDTVSLYKAIRIFGDIGLILILFQVGVESKLSSLLEQMRNALFISVPEVVISGIAMFIPFYYFFNLSIQIALMLSIAFTATSIAISVTPWKESGYLKKTPGQLIVDLSMLDDILGILLMVITFSLLNAFSRETLMFSGIHLLSIFWIILKLLLLIFLAYALSVFVEPKLSKFIKKYEIGPDPVVTIISLALIFSAFASFLGLSFALGSFLIGLSFSRDPSAVRFVASYQSLESFFIPFFFFSIGFSISELGSISLMTVGILFVAAIIGKVVGVGIPSYFLKLSFPLSFLLGLGMVPRAEVALVVISYAKNVFDIPSTIYSESVFVILLTCFTPLLLMPFIQGRLRTKKL